MPNVQINGHIQTFATADEITYDDPVAEIRHASVPECCGTTEHSDTQVSVEQIALIVLLIALGLVYFSKS